MRIVPGLTLIVGLLASSATAVDGVLEIDQACAAGPGCFAGDGPGFPVEISSSGSYRLTSNLSPPDQSTRVIFVNNTEEVTDVTIDLNGFAIQGPNTVTFPSNCSVPRGSEFVGIFTQTTQMVVMNGAVRGMGSHGIYLNNPDSRVEGVIAEQNCGVGILVTTGSLIIDSLARSNSGNGFELFGNSRISNSVAEANGGHGISGTGGGLLIQNCNARGNRGDGIFSAGEDFVLDSASHGNLGDGIQVGANSVVLRSAANGNGGRGTLAGSNSGVGFVRANGNGALQMDGGALLACVLAGASQFCP